MPIELPIKSAKHSNFSYYGSTSFACLSQACEKDILLHYLLFPRRPKDNTFVQDDLAFNGNAPRHNILEVYLSEPYSMSMPTYTFNFGLTPT